MPNFRIILLGAILGMMMTGCTNNKIESRSLRIQYPSVKLNLDPQKMEDAYSMAIVGQIYRGLFRYSTTGEVLNDLVESWAESPDHLNYKFKLKVAKFSDGTPITANYVQMTFARMFRLGSSMAGDIDYIGGSTQFKKIGDLKSFGVHVIAPDVVEFHLDRASSIFLKQLAVVDCSILPITDFKKDPDISKNGAFSGPYKITEDLNNGVVTLTKWRSDLLDSSLPPEKITYFSTTEKPVALAFSNQTDCLDHDRVTIEEKKKLEASGWGSTTTELAGELFVILDPGRIPEPVRSAMVSSVDVTELQKFVDPASYRPAYGLIPFGLAGELTKADVAGLYPKAQPWKLKTIVQLDYDSASELERNIANYLKETWGKLNIEVALNSLATGEKLQHLFGKKSQVIIGRKGMDYPDGFSVLGYFKGNYDSNYFFVSDPKIDSSLASVLQEFDSKVRAEKYKKIQLEILKKHTFIPLLFGSAASGLWSNKVKSVPEHPLGYHTLPMESVEMSN